MKESQLHRYEARARIIKALAHPSRLMIVDLLQEGERSVAALTEAVGADQSTVSKHLALLREAGLVHVRRSGTTSYYQVCCGCLDGLFNCLESILADDVKRRQKAWTGKSVP